MAHELPPIRPTWRADIEGLRGVAVLLVVLYHLRVPGFSGGYVGVDVFFVLSGYLITGILVAEGERNGRIDLARFFARRIRRLLPAAAFVLLATCAAVFYFYSPFEHVAVLKTAKATALYYSNVYFASIALDYHAATDLPNPLLHTWSLAVEEQFYLAWPVLVLLALLGFREGPQEPNRRRLVVAVSVVVALSFILSAVLMAVDRSHWAFFSAQARAWEFGTGALAALVAVPGGRLLAGLRFRGRPLDPAASTVALGWTGLAAVVIAGVFYTDRTPFPGWTALLPVLGTALLLRAGARAERSSLARLLTVRPLRELGRLSYSWYLWHWPALVIVESVWGLQPLGIRVLLGLLALGLSELTYRLIEHPVRHARALAGRPAWGLALLIAITAGSYATMDAWGDATVSRINDPDQYRYTIAKRATYEAHFDALGCTLPAGSDSYADCDLGSRTADTTLVYFGDSHAADLHVALLDIAERRGWRMRSFIKQACPPWEAIPFISYMRRLHTECGPWRERVLGVVEAEHPALVVVKGTGGYRIDPTPWPAAVDSLYARLSPHAGTVVDFRSLPTAPRPEPALCLARARWRGRQQSSCDVPVSTPESWETRLEVAARYDNVFAADFLPEVCPGGRCPAEVGEMVVYRDPSHLTAEFALSLAPLIESELDAALHRTAAAQNGSSPFREAIGTVRAQSE